jgi:hypothetical protein
MSKAPYQPEPEEPVHQDFGEDEKPVDFVDEQEPVDFNDFPDDEADQEAS